MSRRSRNPFSRFFKRSGPSGLGSSSSDVNAPPPSSLSSQSTTPLSYPCTSLLRTPSPAIPPPQPPAPPTLPPEIPPSLPPSLQQPQYPVDYGVVASSSSYDARPCLNHLLLPPTSGSNPYSLQPAPRTSTPQFMEPTSFAGAHNFVIKDSQFNDFSLAGSGLKELLKHSMPDAFYNSAARYPPPRCHLGTRNNYIAKINDWVVGDSDRRQSILWMRGPFGVGKSAVAQSCAEALQSQHKLAATLFFSRSNVDRDDPRRVFTSIAYQIATICPPFRDIVDRQIRNDPALAMKSLSTQFEELLIRPLSQMDITMSGIEGRVVIIDGLDECRGIPEQCEIIRVIATSACERTTPFRWFITSRPEDPIIQTMNSDDVSPSLLQLELPVSRDVDHEILVYLVDEFAAIRKRHRLPDSWPSEEAISLLVDRTAGLWIYATTIIRFKNSLGPRDQLRVVLEFARDISTRVGSDLNPLAEMDFFYTLIIQRVPPRIRAIVQKILLVHSATGWHLSWIAPALDLSEEQIRHSCASIQSVVELQGSDLVSMSFHFYHTSFLDFMEDPERSKDFCVYGNPLIEYRRERLDWLHQVCSRSTGPSHIVFPSEPVLLDGWSHNQYFTHILDCFFCLCSAPNRPIDLQTAASLEKLRFQTVLQLTGDTDDSIRCEHLECFRDNLSTGLRDKIIREDKCPTPGCTNTEDVWILGHGENEAVAAHDSGGYLRLRNNQDPGPGRCFCGSRIKGERDAEPSESESLSSLEN